MIERVGADPVDAGTTSRMRLHLTYRHGEGPSTLLRPALDPDNAWQTDLRTPAYGLTAWLETYASAGYQTDEVSLTLLQRFGTAFDDHGTGNLL
ncbi:hypothetical protein AWC29_27050 [Mycobacterium triplex]|uniref:Uncharacterized protein n=1 Tax=Mycobacterium triplex TaxID=47839 RepID=A0ABX3VZB7_9MYCO|nr:hypothetical protein AWC29_27050 [Mycobacterium triplex]